MKKLLFALLATMVLVACESAFEYISQDHYITQYANVESINSEYVDSAIMVTYIMPEDQVAPDKFAPVSVFAKGENKKIYDSIANKHNDKRYELEIQYWKFGTKLDITCATAGSIFDISSIEVISDDDYDEQHLAGTSLNDCFTFTTLSTYPFLKSGYQSKYYYKNDSKDTELFYLYGGTGCTAKDYVTLCDGGYYSPLHVIEKSLNSVSNEDLTLVGCATLSAFPEDNKRSILAFILTPKTKPTLAKMQHFTIKVNADNGQTFTTKCTVAFE